MLPMISVLRRKVLCGAAQRFAAVLLVSLSIVACATTNVPAPPNNDSRAALVEILSPANGASIAGAPSRLEQVRKFYEARGFQPAWTGGPAEEDMGREINAVLAHAHEQGLRDDEYQIRRAARAPGVQAAQYEVALTDALLRYAHDVRSGRFRPAEIHTDVLLPVVTTDTVKDLSQAVTNRSLAQYLADLPPVHPEYRRLVVALAKYRAVRADAWPALSAQREIRLDGRDAQYPLLVKRLAAEDAKLAGSAKPSIAEMRDALKRFQLRNGLADDGRAGLKTIEALNVPASFRVSQIAANMERWRWMPRRFETRYVAVNVPDQSVAYVRDGTVALTSRVIVGRKTSPTPIVRAEISTVVANPPWNIPGDIAARDLLPRLRKNANYLATRNMVVMDGPKGDPQGRTIDWKKIVPAEFPYAIRQLPGPQTGLGEIMLDSPNDFDVYLHDTPDKKLYASDMREISNGCVRVQEIFALTSLALTDDEKEAVPELRKITRTSETQRMPLSKPLPVYFLYWTALAGEDGSIGFRPDRYGRDAAMIAALAKPNSVVPPMTTQTMISVDDESPVDESEELAP